MAGILIPTIFYFSNFLIFLIFVRAILSWFPEPRSNGFLRDVYYFLLKLAHTITEPITGPIRNLIRRSPLGGPGMVIDFSPVIALLLIQFVRNILIGYLS